jgi:hypothetical protein
VEDSSEQKEDYVFFRYQESCCAVSEDKVVELLQGPQNVETHEKQGHSCLFLVSPQGLIPIASCLTLKGHGLDVNFGSHFFLVLLADESSIALQVSELPRLEKVEKKQIKDLPSPPLLDQAWGVEKVIEHPKWGLVGLWEEKTLGKLTSPIAQINIS